MNSKRTNFGEAVSSHLADRSMSQTALAQSAGMNAAYLNHTITGYRRPTASWTDLVANALQLDDNQRKALHKAAAKDNGFNLD